ncbi:hypothetical protein Goshw_011182 [Gossypium schwendimanii]|uniref:Uncharacterized protein n=1 Tax=Gossypium schwendimanii TaxID=34291 RepID=A0A7J9MYU9_GOSSC|nr:hypothetical protein [Gossypium schwendimanii]
MFFLVGKVLLLMNMFFEMPLVEDMDHKFLMRSWEKDHLVM